MSSDVKDLCIGASIAVLLACTIILSIGVAVGVAGYYEVQLQHAKNEPPLALVAVLDKAVDGALRVVGGKP